MRGGNSKDSFAGGAGSDEIRAGGGNDLLSGDAEFDPIVDPSSGVARDVLDGGRGSDIVDYGRNGRI